MYVVRTELADRRHLYAKGDAMTTLILRALDVPTYSVRFDTFASESLARATGDEVYRLLFEVKGPWTDVPSHAVYAAWQVNDPTRAVLFEESRRQLFTLRSQVLATFAYDWLLKRLDHEGRYIVLGLYGDEEGATRLCREHPEVVRFVQANPATSFTAVDLTGLRCFRVETGT